MLGKIVRFKTRSGAIREGRVKEQYVVHGRTRYVLQTEFGNVYVDADEIENIVQAPPKPPAHKPR